MCRLSSYVHSEESVERSIHEVNSNVILSTVVTVAILEVYYVAAV